MDEAAQSGYLNAMAAATYLVHKGVPFRTAHEKIGNAVRFALEKGVELGDLTLDELREFGAEFDEDFFCRHYSVGQRSTATTWSAAPRASACVRHLPSASDRVATLYAGGRSCWCVRPCSRTPPTSTTW